MAMETVIIHKGTNITPNIAIQFTGWSLLSKFVVLLEWVVFCCCISALGLVALFDLLLFSVLMLLVDVSIVVIGNEVLLLKKRRTERSFLYKTCPTNYIKLKKYNNNNSKNNCPNLKWSGIWQPLREHVSLLKEPR